MNARKSVEECFYQDVADALGVAHLYKPFPYRRATRWNNRNAGNGRFPGRGVVRLFGSESVHVSLRDPKTNQWFFTRQAALEFLRSIGPLGMDSNLHDPKAVRA